MGEFRVTSKELKNKASELRQINNQFKKSVEELTATEKQLVGMWDGNAKEAFHTEYSNDVSQMDVFYQTIEKYCQALENNANKYEIAEQKNLDTASTRTYK